MRIGGLASGMDIDTLVADLMKAERIPLDKLTQKKQITEWQRDQYREMNTALQGFDSTIFGSVFLQKSFIAKKVTSSNESAVSAVSISSVSNVSNKMDVINLAEAASWKADGDVNTASGLFTGGKVTTETELKFKVKDPGTSSFRDVTFKVSQNDTIDTVIERINSSGLGVSALRAQIDVDTNPSDAVYDYQNRVVFTSNQTGSNGELVAANDATNNFLRDLGFTVPATGAYDIDTDANTSLDGYRLQKDATKQGANAVVKVNGYQMEQTANVFSINGIQYTIKGPTTSSVSISTATDVDTIFNNIKAFVDKYNEVLDKVNGKLDEERYRSYTPLTDEQKEAMTEKQIESWEERAKSGLLRNDSLLSRGLNQMRMDLYARVGNSSDSINDQYDQLSEVGIKTSSNYLDKGKLIIENEDKLKEAISNDPDAVYKLFANDGTTFESKGIARRLRDTIKTTISSVEGRAGKAAWTNQKFTLGKELNSINNRIDSFQDRLQQIEDRYWRQFTAMEKAIQSSNQQSAYLSQFSGGA
jgi:flagellar hook-associated protein 2